MAYASSDFLIACRYRCELVMLAAEDGWAGLASDMQADRLVFAVADYGVAEDRVWRRTLATASRLPEAVGQLIDRGEQDDGSRYAIFSLPADFATAGRMAEAGGLHIVAAVPVLRRACDLLNKLYKAGLTLRGPLAEHLLIATSGQVQLTACVTAGVADQAVLIGQVEQLLCDLTGTPDRLDELNLRGWKSLQALTYALREAETSLLADDRALIAAERALTGRLAAALTRPRPKLWPRRVAGLTATMLLTVGAGYGAKVYAEQLPVPVPDAQRALLDDARRQLQARGFAVAVTRRPGGRLADEVVGQTPKPGGMIRPGGTVRLTVTSGSSKQQS